MTVPTFSINQSIPREAGQGPNWKPPVWSAGAAGIIVQAHAANAAGYSGAFAAAGAHSNPPSHTWERDT